MTVPQPTYLFYDLETSGLNPCFDQVMQFAAIRTDMQLNEIERYDWLVQLNHENIPNPSAVMTHGITPDICANGKTDYASTLDIFQILNIPGTQSGGYNTLNFDDTVLRFSFYRHLLPPYTHQYNNGCGRFDCYPMALLYYLYADSDIVWPNRGPHLSMKLEDLNRANNLAHGQAHEAMCDVEATLALAKIFKKDAQRFDYAMGFFNKRKDLDRMNMIKTPMSIAVDGKLGARKRFQTLVVPIGQHHHYTNQSLWLCIDTIDFSTCEPEQLCDESMCLRKRAGEAPIILPALERFLEPMDSKRLELAERNLAWLESHPKEALTLRQHYQQHTFPVVEQADPFAKLYQLPFASKTDTALMRQFHKSNPNEKINIASKFDADIYNILAKRLCASTYADYCSEEFKTDYLHYTDSRLGLNDLAPVDFRNEAALTRPKAKQLCDTLLQDTHLSEQQKQLILQYRDWLNAHTHTISSIT